MTKKYVCTCYLMCWWKLANLVWRFCLQHFQDYPSVGQIIQKARENNINLIFVIGGYDTVTRSQYYDPLTKFLPGEIRKSFPLDINATNILEIIRESYKVNSCVNICMHYIPHAAEFFRRKSLKYEWWYLPFLYANTVNNGWMDPRWFGAKLTG